MAKCEERQVYRYATRTTCWINGFSVRVLSVVTFVCWLMATAGATATSTQTELTHRPPNIGVESSRAAALTALAAIARRHPERFPRLLAAFATAAAAAAVKSDKDGDGGGGGGTEYGARVPRWETPSEAADWTTSEGGETLEDTSNDAAEDMSPAFTSGTASKRALSVLSRWQPFTSLGNAGRRASRFPHRGRPIGGPRDFISAETRGDFGDRPIGQPMRWGRR